MPKPSLLLCGPALNAEESAASLDLLGRVTLDTAAKVLVTTGKFSATEDVKTINVDAHYSAESAYLQTLLYWGGFNDRSDPRFRDGYDIYCLGKILARFKNFDHAAVLREGADEFQERWPQLQEELEGRSFLTFGGGASNPQSGRPTILVSLKNPATKVFLDAAWDLYRTGAVYGMQNYSTAAALGLAGDAAKLKMTRPKPDTTTLRSGEESDLGSATERLIDSESM